MYALLTPEYKQLDNTLNQQAHEWTAMEKTQRINEWVMSNE